MGGGSPTAHAGSLLTRSGGLAWTVRMQDRRWQLHRPCWVVARNRGLAMWTQDRRWQPHRPCWVVARETRGLRGRGHKTGGGSPTAHAGSLLAKSGGPYGHGSPIAHAGSLLAKSGG